MKKSISIITVLMLVFAFIITPANVSAIDENVYILTDKNTYKQGENITVTASGGDDKSWVGLYPKGAEYGSSGIASYYWYYVNDSSGESKAGIPVCIQDQNTNVNMSVLPAGEYEIHLFKDNGYNVISTVEITVTEKILDEKLESISYRLDNKADGYANGSVTVTAGSDNAAGLDCIMFWADNEGIPLKDYTSLAKFKLTGTVTVHDMYDYTIIPEGAEKLIAYISQNGKLSEESVSVDLPENCNYKLNDDYNAEFQLISDTHITTDLSGSGSLYNQHFTQMLMDVKNNSPESMGIFINGDITNNGKEEEYQRLVSLYNDVKGSDDFTDLHIAIGNHDWMQGNTDGMFQKYAKILNNGLTAQPETVYYDEVVNGYHFIYLGGEQSGTNAVLSQTQLDWLDNKMKTINSEDPEKPVFILLHQPLYNTVAGSLSGQGWHGVSNEEALRNILKKYDQIIIAGGHSHWELNSECNMYPGSDDMSVAVNTASVGYLWSSYNVAAGEHADGSNGYYVRIYDDKVVFLGRDIENSLFIPSAMFVVEKNHINVPNDVYTIDCDDESADLGVSVKDDLNVKFDSSDKSVVNVSYKGMLHPVSEGTADITITAYASGRYVRDQKTVKVIVTDLPEADLPDTDDPADDKTDCEKGIHDIGDWEIISPAGCEISGKMQKKCSNCEYAETKSITPLGHTPKEKTSCIESQLCTVCGTVLMPPEKHKLVYLAPVEPTCTSNGWTGGTWCEICGKVIVKQELISKLDHSGTDTIIKATTVSDGEIINECSCGKILSSEIIFRAKTVKLSGSKYVFNNKSRNPSVIIKDKNGEIIGSDNYTVEKSKGRKNIGTYTYTVKFKKLYSGKKTLKFDIIPKSPSNVKVSAGKKSFTLKWGKLNTAYKKQITGYQIRYNTSSSKLKKTNPVTIKNSSLVSKKIKNLKSRKYYVQIRTYKNVNGKKYYSGWSVVKSVKVK